LPEKKATKKQEKEELNRKTEYRGTKTYDPPKLSRKKKTRTRGGELQNLKRKKKTVKQPTSGPGRLMGKEITTGNDWGGKKKTGSHIQQKRNKTEDSATGDLKACQGISGYGAGKGKKVCQTGYEMTQKRGKHEET